MTTCDGAEGTAASRRVKSDHSEQQDCTKKCTDDNGKSGLHTATAGGTVTSSGQQLRCFYSNANSLIGKFDEFKFRAAKYDIVGVVETWASEKIFEAELAMES